MKRSLSFFAAIGALLLSACSYQPVPSGNVGVKVNLLGTDKGVSETVLPPGRYFPTWNEEIYLFPTFTQNYTWKGAESINFQTVEGMVVSADVGISYYIKPEKVSLVFQKYRKGIDEITDIYLRNMVKDALVAASSDRPIETVYGKGKADLIAEVQRIVSAQVADFGIVIEKVYWVSDVRLPDTVVKSLNAKIEATQIALQRENEVKTAEAQAAIEIAKAKGEAESLRLRSEAEANAIRVKAQALESNPKLVDLNAVEKWDGKLPQNMYSSGPVPFINVK